MDIVTYKGKPYKQVKFNLFVNNYGIGAVKWTEDKRYSSGKKQLQYISWHIQKSDGRRYIIDDHKHLLLDELIGKTFGDKNGFRGSDGRSWEITYVDGDVNHCYQSNLVWKLRLPSIDSTTGRKKMDMVIESSDVSIFEDGVIVVDKDTKTPILSNVDADTNLFWATDPSVGIPGPGIYQKLYSVDALMAKGNFVDGDPAMYERPVILHRDMDYKNHASTNLEWCDMTDPRYVEYCKRKRRAQDLLEASLNPEKRLFRTLRPIEDSE